MILHSDNRGGDRMSSTVEQDFQPLPSYNQSRMSNATYTSVVTTRTDPDGSTSQSLQILTKR